MMEDYHHLDLGLLLATLPAGKGAPFPPRRMEALVLASESAVKLAWARQSTLVLCLRQLPDGHLGASQLLLQGEKFWPGDKAWGSK